MIPFELLKKPERCRQDLSYLCTMAQVIWFVWVFLLASTVSGSDFYKNDNNLDDSNKNLTVLTENDLSHFWNAQKLEIENNNVKIIKENTFRKLIILKRLSLKHNLIEEVRNGVFNGLPLDELDLSDNLIRTIEPEAFDNMDFLRKIKLKDNNLKVYENRWFLNTPRLCEINFEHNKIVELPEELLAGTKPCTVDIIFSHNMISRVHPQALINIDKFYKLYLDHNFISDVGLPHIKFIKHLRLNDNKLSCVFFNDTLVEIYDVSNNPLDITCWLKFLEKKTPNFL